MSVASGAKTPGTPAGAKTPGTPAGADAPGRPGRTDRPGRGAAPVPVPPDLLAGLFDGDVVSAASPLVADPDALDAAERELVAKAVASRRGEFAQGRVLAHALLADLGLDVGPILRDDDRVPRWPAGAVGCISHTRDLCAVAVARAADVAGVGLDVEGAAPLEADLRAKICTPEERDWLAGRGDREAGVLGKAIFSVKECVYKACFPTLRERWGFQDLVVALDPEAGRFVATPRRGVLAGQALAGRAERREAWWLAGFTWRASPPGGPR